MKQPFAQATFLLDPKVVLVEKRVTPLLGKVNKDCGRRSTLFEVMSFVSCTATVRLLRHARPFTGEPLRQGDSCCCNETFAACTATTNLAKRRSRQRADWEQGPTQAKRVALFIRLLNQTPDEGGLASAEAETV